MVPFLADSGSFYDEVLRELVFVLGAALFVANAYALYRRRADSEAAVRRTVARSRPGSPVRGNRRSDDTDLPQAPLARTITYTLVGFFVMIAGLGAVLNK
ncbi:MAG: hypothetical protein QOE62_2788 [Actinomycetota bacterium]|jgi:hypothetical protein|nr:hypothetical protein [Actinomycetota bacterium]